MSFSRCVLSPAARVLFASRNEMRTVISLTFLCSWRRKGCHDLLFGIIHFKREHLKRIYIGRPSKTVERSISVSASELLVRLLVLSLVMFPYNPTCLLQQVFALNSSMNTAHEL